MATARVEPLDSFLAVHTVLKRTGIRKLNKGPGTGIKQRLYQLYRCLSFFVIVLVNVRRIAFIVQRRQHSHHVFHGLALEIPDMNLLIKYLTLNFQSRRIERMYELLKSQTFAANTKQEEELLIENKQEMHKLCKLFILGVTLTALVWPLYYFAERSMDETSLVPVYVPFDTDTWSRFTWCVLFEIFPIPWVGYGHIGLDCLVTTFYAHAHTQFKIIRYNLEHLFDDHNISERPVSLRSNSNNSICLDENVVKTRFIYLVKRYEQLVWFIKEIESVFNMSTSFQFLTSGISLCMAIYRISTINLLSLQFMFLFGLLAVQLTQIFLYCFFGNLIQYESNSMNDSIYLSDWWSASPQLRRSFLIAMCRWSKTITPKASSIIPLSLTTFISITRSGYSIFAVLTTREN